MLDQLKILCKYCGHFKRFNNVIKEKEEISFTWKKAYKKYKEKKPTLILY